MPTSRPRHTLTETDALKDTLDRASELFPDAPSRTALLHAVIELGDTELRRRDREAAERQAQDAERLRYLAAVSTGQLAGIDADELRAVRHRGYD